MFNPSELSHEGLSRMALALGGYAQRSFRIRMYNLFQGETTHPVLREMHALRWNLDMSAEQRLANGTMLYRVLADNRKKIVGLRAQAIAATDEEQIKELYDEARELAIQMQAAELLLERARG